MLPKLWQPIPADHDSSGRNLEPLCHKGKRTVSKEDVQVLVSQAIRAHELCVAFWSGLLGAALLFGTWHAIWLLATVSPLAVR